MASGAKSRPERRKGKPGPDGLYTKELGDMICDQLATGRSLRSICRELGTLDHSTVLKWARNADHPIFHQYAHAREVGYLALADEITDIVDDGRNDWMERELPNGQTITVLNREAVDRSKLRFEARRWMLSKMLPKVYGDRATVEHTGDAFKSFLDSARAAQLAKMRNPNEDEEE
jgi:transposase